MAFECKFCAKIFVREATFMKHKCAGMARAEDIRTPDGIAAYTMYGYWMRNFNRKTPPIETFSTSRYFRSFVNFVVKSRKLRLPSPETFIKLMSDKSISPMLWCRDECYSLYLEWIDRTSDPLDQASTTVETLYRIADAAEIDVTKVFSIINYREVMQLIRQRLLSPWLLLCSKAFKTFLIDLNASEKDELLNLIGYAYWAEKFEANPKIVEHMKVIATELGV
jgi:hypothetical protein